FGVGSWAFIGSWTLGVGSSLEVGNWELGDNSQELQLGVRSWKLGVHWKLEIGSWEFRDWADRRDGHEIRVDDRWSAGSRRHHAECRRLAAMAGTRSYGHLEGDRAAPAV